MQEKLFWISKILYFLFTHLDRISKETLSILQRVEINYSISNEIKE